MQLLIRLPHNHLSSALPDLNFGSKVDKDKDNAGSSDGDSTTELFSDVSITDTKINTYLEATLRYERFQGISHP